MQHQYWLAEISSMQLLLNWKNYKQKELSTKIKLETLISSISAWKIKSCNSLEKYSYRRGFACLEAIQKGSTSSAKKDSLFFFKKKIRVFYTV